MVRKLSHFLAEKLTASAHSSQSKAFQEPSFHHHQLLPEHFSRVLQWIPSPQVFAPVSFQQWLTKLLIHATRCKFIIQERKKLEKDIAMPDTKGGILIFWILFHPWRYWQTYGRNIYIYPSNKFIHWCERDKEVHHTFSSTPRDDALAKVSVQ